MRTVYTATLYGATPEILQDVFYTFEGFLKTKSFFEDGGDLYEVNQLNISVPILIEVQDVELDMITAIREELGLSDSDVVNIECEITKQPITELEEKYNVNEMFVGS
jgi:hypothetical protein